MTATGLHITYRPPAQAPSGQEAAAARLVDTVRRWTSDHGMNGKPCCCLLCSALARYDQETAR